MADDKRPKTEDYEVGYHRPPKHTRFQKGQSGNPKGRAKKGHTVLDVRLIIEDVLERPVAVDNAGKRQTMSRMQAILEAERRNALNGNLRSIQALLKKAERSGLVSKPQPQSGTRLTEPDEKTGDTGRIVRMFRLEQDPMGKFDRRHQALRVWQPA